jgi:hypothetical protein
MNKRINIYISNNYDFDYLEVTIYSIIINTKTPVTIYYNFQKPISDWLSKYVQKQNHKIYRVRNPTDIQCEDKIIQLSAMCLVMDDLSDLYNVHLTKENPVATSYQLFVNSEEEKQNLRPMLFPAVFLNKSYLAKSSEILNKTFAVSYLHPKYCVSCDKRILLPQLMVNPLKLNYEEILTVVAKPSIIRFSKCYDVTEPKLIYVDTWLTYYAALKSSKYYIK